MNEFEICIDEWAARCREKDERITTLSQQVAALAKERDCYYHKAIEFEHQLFGDPGYGMGVVHIAQELKRNKETLQASLDAEREKVRVIEQVLDIDSGKTTLEKVVDLKHSFKQVWGSYQDAVNEMFKAQGTLTQERTRREAADADIKAMREEAEVVAANALDTLKEDKARIDDLRSKLAAAQDDNRTYIDERHENMKKLEELTTLRALVRALPKVEGLVLQLRQYAGHWLVLEQSGPSVVMRGRFRSHEEARAYQYLLSYRATLDAAPDTVGANNMTEEQRFIAGCCDKPDDCKWGGPGGCGYEGRKHELKKDAPKGGEGE